MMTCKPRTLSLLLFCIVPLVQCFNLDLNTKTVYRQSPGSMFGYAVDLYSGRAGSYVLVGAPKADSNAFQPGVEEGGVVYRCALDSFSCTPIPFDRDGNRRSDNRNASFGGNVLQTESKSHQWFGATVRSSRFEDKVIACAPRYLWYYTTFYRTDPVGHCYVGSNGFSSFEELSPCKHPRLYDYHQLGYCMAGFSAGLPRGGKLAYMGGPGAWYWQGSFLVQGLMADNEIRRSKIGPDYTDNDYMGYAMAVGDFDGDGDEDAAMGVPRGDLGTGKVVLFNSGIQNLVNVSGDQVGSYFGASVSAGDVDGDGQVDLIIGAPFYSVHDRVNNVVKTQYEVGRVYIYFQGAVSRFTKFEFLTGEQEWARFGHSVAFAGDLNADGYGDIVVGAPFAGEDRRGAVFVFQGKEGGIRNKYSQAIYAKEVESTVFTFGWSLDGGRDLDQNEYPDVVIGAYKSDHAVFLKSRPIVTLKGDLKLNPQIIDLELDRECTLRNGQQVACGRVSLCLSYSGKGAPGRITVNALVQLDVDNFLANRTLFLIPEGKSELVVPFTFSQGQRPCELRHFYIDPNVRDKLTPIKVVANYSLPESDSQLRTITPVLDYYGVTSLSSKMEIKKDCGPDNKCVPDLAISSIDMKMCREERSEPGGKAKVTCADADTFTVGKDKIVNLTVTVENRGEAGYESTLSLSVPSNLDYVDFIKKSDFPAVCATPEGYEQSYRSNERYNITCDIGNPLPRATTMVLTFLMTVRDTSVQRSDIKLVVNTTNPEEDFTLFNNQKEVTVSLEARPKIFLFNRSEPQNIDFNEAGRHEGEVVWDFDVGPNVTHIYQLRNDGPTTVEKAKLDIYWPMTTASGKYLLYLSTLPRVYGPGSCEVHGVTNPEGLGVYPTGPDAEYRRHKRQVGESETVGDPSLFSQEFRKIINQIKNAGEDGIDLEALRRHRVNCEELKCVHIECDIGPLGAETYVVVTVESHLWISTLLDESYFDASVSSAAVALVTALPFTVSEMPVKAAVATTYLRALKDPRVARGIPWWLWLIAALVGLVFLLLLALLLWRLGFFTRKRPPREKALLARPHPQTEYYGYPSYGTHL